MSDLRQTLDRDLSSSYTIERELHGGGMSAVDIHDLSLLTGATPLLDPTFDPLRDDPRFTRILARMNLSQFQRR